MLGWPSRAQLPVGALPTPARLSAPASSPELSGTFLHAPSFWGLLSPCSLPGLAVSSSAALPRTGALRELGGARAASEAQAQLSSRSALCRPLGSGLEGFCQRDPEQGTEVHRSTRPVAAADTWNSSTSPHVPASSWVARKVRSGVS